MQYKIIVDKQSRTNPSSEKKEYIIDIEELRVLGDVYDSLIITPQEDYVMRRLKLSEYHVLSVLEEPIKQPITDVKIELFEGDNYIYLVDMTGNKFYAEYLVKNDFNNTFATRVEMNSVINQTAQNIELSVNQKFTGYSTTEEMNAAINIKADSITSEVRKTYASKEEMSSSITQTAEEIKSIVSVSIGTVNLASNSDFSHQNSNNEYDLEKWTRFGNLQSEAENENNKVMLVGEKTWLRLYKNLAGSIGISQILKPVRQNENYTLSFKLKNNSLSSGQERRDVIGFTIYFYSSDNAILDKVIKNFTIQDTTSEQSFNFTFQTPNDENLNYIDFRIQVNNLDGTVFDSNITNIQLEIGKVATDWRASQTDYYDKIEQYSKVVQTVDEISTEVSKKVGNNEIISKINQSAEAVGIQANKINLTANDILNLISGNAINLTSKNITITSNAFKVDKNGKVTCSDIDITGGRIVLESSEGNCNVIVKGNDSLCELYGNSMSIFENLDVNIPAGVNVYISNGEGGLVAVKRTTGGSPVETRVLASGITTPTLTQTSLKSKKKNIKKLTLSASELIKNSDICLYNFKDEKAKSKKHIGLVIGNGYNCPDEVISQDGQGVDQYSMISLAWKAIQELIEENNNLKQRIEKLEAK